MAPGSLFRPENTFLDPGAMRGICSFPSANEVLMHTWVPFQAHLPFAVVGSTEEVKVGNKLVRARQYPWGVVQGKCGGHIPNCRPELSPPLSCCLRHLDPCPTLSSPAHLCVCLMPHMHPAFSGERESL